MVKSPQNIMVKLLINDGYRFMIRIYSSRMNFTKNIRILQPCQKCENTVKFTRVDHTKT